MNVTRWQEPACRALRWLVPWALCLALYRTALDTWFQQDDFAWLALHESVRDFPSLLRTLFEPMAQGTIRPWSERGYFLVMRRLFGLDPLPFRMVAFATQFANLALLGSIAMRITGSRAAGLLAPAFWVLSGTLGTSLAWSSAYNQILCGLFLLLSLHWFLRYTECGEPRDYWRQWCSFLLGFGALELNVVYPALVSSYAFLRARRYLRDALWMFVPAVLYAALHRWLAPRPAEGAYAMDFRPLSLIRTAWHYWWSALGGHAATIRPLEPPAGTVMHAAAGLLIALVAVFLLWQLGRRQWLPALFTAWFFMLLGPVLPLSGHLSMYYLTLPTLALAILGAWALVDRWHGPVWGRVAALVAAGLYCVSGAYATLVSTEWQYERALAVRYLVVGVQKVHELHPGKVILLANVSSDLFWSALVDRPFRAAGIPHVYLVPGSEETINKYPELGDVAHFVYPPAQALKRLTRREAVVYSVEGNRLRNVTARYTAVARAQWRGLNPNAVDAGRTEDAQHLGTGWYSLEGAFRWMGKRATVRLAGPHSTRERLRVAGYITRPQLEAGPLTLTFTAGGHPLEPVRILRDGAFSASFALPEELVGKPEMEVAVEVDRVIHAPGDQRALGAAFGRFSVE